MNTFPKEIKMFINSATWIFAKTYAKTWPHEYIVKDEINRSAFESMVKHIQQHGYLGKFYQKDITYFDDSNIVYWTMGAPIEETTIINRCEKEQSYEYRLKHNTLPT